MFYFRLHSVIARRRAGAPLDDREENKLVAVFGGYSRTDATVQADNHPPSAIRDLLSLTVMKQKYYGYGLNINPHAELDDGKLHVRGTNSGLMGILYGLVTSKLASCQIGDYVAASQVMVKTNDEVGMQIDGNFVARGREFLFQVLPAELKLRH